MHIRVFAGLMVAIALLTFVAGCGKQDIGGYEGLGKGQIYSFQEPHPGKARVVGRQHVVLYVELPSEAVVMDIQSQGIYSTYPFVVRFTDKEGIIRKWDFLQNIKVPTEQGMYEISHPAIREVNVCVGVCPNYN